MHYHLHLCTLMVQVKFSALGPLSQVCRETRCAGCLCTSSGWFKPCRTFPNHIIPEIAKCVEFCNDVDREGSVRSNHPELMSHTSLGWFDCTNLLYLHCYRGNKCLCTSSGWFKHIEPSRIFSNHIIAEIARCVEFCHMSSGWFD